MHHTVRRAVSDMHSKLCRWNSVSTSSERIDGERPIESKTVLAGNVLTCHDYEWCQQQLHHTPCWLRNWTSMAAII